MIKVGDKVKFKDNLWERKKTIGLGGGLFGYPLKKDAENKFTVTSVNNQGTKDNPDFELSLNNYPWLVYLDEMEIIND